MDLLRPMTRPRSWLARGRWQSPVGRDIASVLEAENPGGLSEAASAAVWRHAPGLENGFAGGSGDRVGRGGHGELPPGGAANDAHEEDGSDASSAAECGGESAGGESRSRVRPPLLACVSDILSERDRCSNIVEALSAGYGLPAIDLRSNCRSSNCAASPSEQSGAEAMLISNVASR
jgi:hypothetical protein